MGMANVGTSPRAVVWACTCGSGGLLKPHAFTGLNGVKALYEEAQEAAQAHLDRRVNPARLHEVMIGEAELKAVPTTTWEWKNL